MTHEPKLPDLHGRHAVITGANGLLGSQTARRLMAAGAHVTLAVRNVDRGEEVRRRISPGVAGSAVVARVDLADLGSIRDFAAQMSAAGAPIDLLINNAATKVTAFPPSTVDGFEARMGINMLGHYALTGRLLPLLQAASAARVVSLGSIAARSATLVPSDFAVGRGGTALTVYGRSKRACMVFAAELGREAARHGVDLISLSAHPGYAVGDPALAEPGAAPLARLTGLAAGAAKRLGLIQFAAGGAETIVHAATAPGLHSGDYVAPGGLQELAGEPALVRPPAQVLDPRVGRRMWRSAATLTGVVYDWS